MTEKIQPDTELRFGEWPSPITAHLVASNTASHSHIQVLDEEIYWLESLPEENNRHVIVCQKMEQGKAKEDPRIITPPGFNVRSQVHEYGGAAYLITQNENKIKTAFFCNFEDQRVYKQDLDKGLPEPLSPEGFYRYTDFSLDKKHKRLFAVRENYEKVQKHLSDYPENEIVIIDIQSGETDVLIRGADFFSSPRISPDGKKLCWLCWDHPQMPWDGTECWVAELNDYGLPISGVKAAGDTDESIFQPQWSPDNVLHFISDRSGWWNLYRQTSANESEALYPMEAEFGRPQWIFGQSCYDFDDENNIVCCYNQSGNWRLAKLNITTESNDLLGHEEVFADIGFVKSFGNQCVFVASFTDKAEEIHFYDFEHQRNTALKSAHPLPFDSAYISKPESLSFKAKDDSDVQGFYYPACNKDYIGSGKASPLIIKSHGGPSSASNSALDLSLQFWTSRGFAVFDVNYRGSTGFGRTFREKLKNGWGEVDVEDCISAAEHLVAINKADKNRLIIRGSSAGGYTTLCALTFNETFKAGASYYGISDIKTLAEDCHKFESCYVENLMGPLPEQESLYYERSPIHFPEKLSCPIIFFQGSKDHVVPRNQARTMVSELKEKNLPVAYVEFEDEYHGFRQTNNITQSLENELFFYRKVLDLRNTEELQEVEIFNLACD